MEEKERLRQTVSAALAGLTAAQKQDESRDLVQQLDERASCRFEVILATWPLADEPDIVPFLAQWSASGGRLAFPRTGPGRSLTFHIVSSLEGPWERRSFGLREPLESAPLWTPGPPTLCLVPGLAFARADQGGCWRLGRGAGYYDRWLQANGAHVNSWGVGFSVQGVQEVPVEPHDRRLDGLVLAKG